MAHNASASQTIALLPPVLPANVSYKSARMAQRMAQDMTFLHNLFIRGFNSIILQAPYVTPGTTAAGDILNFTNYLTDFLHHHHDIEEDFCFPEFEKIIGEKGFMDRNIEQHHAFESKLATLIKYAQETSAADYSSTELLSLVQDMLPPLVEHLAAEITTLKSLDGRASEKEFERVWKESEDYAKAQNEDPTKFLPLMLGLSDATYPKESETSVKLPWFLNYLTYFKYGNKHKGAWRFLPSDFWSQPKPCALLPKESGGLGQVQ